MGLGSHHAELALVDKGLKVLNLLLEGGVLDVLCGVRVGGLSASLSVGEGRHLEGLFVECGKCWYYWAGNAEEKGMSATCLL